MSNTELEEAIETAWIDRDSISPNTKGDTRDAIEQTLNALDSGSLRAKKIAADVLKEVYEVTGLNSNV